MTHETHLIRALEEAERAMEKMRDMGLQESARYTKLYEVHAGLEYVVFMKDGDGQE